MERAISVLGLFVFIGIAFALSNNKKAIKWRTVIWGVALQLILGVLVLRTHAGFVVFNWMGDRMTDFLNFSDAGAQFVFGDRFTEFYFAFKVLPTIIFFSAVISLLYYFGVLQRIVEVVAWIMMRTMKTSGTESLAAAVNIFVGQTEAPLLVKPYVPSMTMSELHAVMVGGFASIAGGVLAAFVAFGVPAEHLIAASVMSAPASLAIAKLMYPETDESVTAGVMKIKIESPSVNALDALASGITDGLYLVLNVAAMLIGFIAMLACLNAILGWAGGYVGLPQLSLEWLFSYLFAPIAWLMGVPWQDCGQVGVLLGKKTALNEFIAYADLRTLIDNNNAVAAGTAVVGEKPTISERSVIIATYALCGFANFSSIGIQIGGIGSMAPDRKGDLARLGMRAMIAGSITTFMMACIAGMLL